jgi:hypothetical protein
VEEKWGGWLAFHFGLRRVRDFRRSPLEKN